MGWIRSQEFPIVTGPLVSIARAGLIARSWSDGLTVRTKKPAGTVADPLTRRMVAVRNDGGPTEGRTALLRVGVNVWADDPIEAERIALDLVSIFQACPNGVVVTATSGFSLPYEVPVDVPITAGNKNLTNFYFSFRCGVKASAA